MRQKLRTIVILFAVGVILAALALNGLAYRHAYAMMHFTQSSSRTLDPEKLSLAQKLKVLICGVNIPRPRSTIVASELGEGTRSFQIECTNGVKLGAWYCPATNQASIVILFHGYSGEKSGTLPEAKAFREMGFSVLMIDFRGSGDSSESYTTIGYNEADDVAQSVRYARENLPHKHIILYGQSMGAAAILRAVNSRAVRPDAIIAEAVFDEMLKTVRHRFEAMGVPSFPGAELLVFWGGRQAGFNGFKHNPADYATSVECPILFLHGAADSRARVEDGRRVFDAVKAAKRFEEFPAIGHAPILERYPAEWKRAIETFLREQSRLPRSTAAN